MTTAFISKNSRKEEKDPYSTVRKAGWHLFGFGHLPSSKKRFLQ